MRKLDFILPAVMVVMGALGIVSFGVLAAHGLPLGRRIPALILAVAMVAVGVLMLVSYYQTKKELERKKARRKSRKQ